MAWTARSTLNVTLCIDSTGSILASEATHLDEIASGLTASGGSSIFVAKSTTAELKVVLMVQWRTPDGLRMEIAAAVGYTAAGGWVQVTNSVQMFH